jgi:hypothetical protein
MTAAFGQMGARCVVNYVADAEGRNKAEAEPLPDARVTRGAIVGRKPFLVQRGGRCTRNLWSVNSTKHRAQDADSSRRKISAMRAASALRPGTRRRTSIRP